MPKGVDALRASFDEAASALKKLEASPQPRADDKQVNLATSLLYDLERQIMRVPEPEEREEWRERLDALQDQLNAAAGDASPSPSPAGAAIQEGVGDIDELLNGMQLSDAAGGPRPDFVPQAVPGRRYMRVVRPGDGSHRPTVAPAPPAAPGAAPPLPDASDAVGQGEEDAQVDSDDEAARYKPQTAEPAPRLRVELPEMPLAEAAAAAGAASHGSADSTMARRGGEAGGSDSDDDSITSPENADEISSFR